MNKFSILMTQPRCWILSLPFSKEKHSGISSSGFPSLPDVDGIVTLLKEDEQNFEAIVVYSREQCSFVYLYICNYEYIKSTEHFLYGIYDLLEILININ